MPTPTERRQFVQAKREFAPHGIRLTYNKDYDEYSVLPTWRKQAEYFTNDFTDAIQTGNHMIASRKVKNPGKRSQAGRWNASDKYGVYGPLGGTMGTNVIHMTYPTLESAKRKAAQFNKMYGRGYSGVAVEYVAPALSGHRGDFRKKNPGKVKRAVRRDLAREDRFAGVHKYVPRKAPYGSERDVQKAASSIRRGRFAKSPMYRKAKNPQVGDYELTLINKIRGGAGIPFGTFAWKNLHTGVGGRFGVYAKRAAPPLYSDSPPVVVPASVVTAAKKVLKGKV